ncbi:MAG: tetratricopeptide repeat protein [Alphaproteobacteria bacterium]|nr:tetratricopeptide repeat protein [Alphaproteobacteria bacterium]
MTPPQDENLLCDEASAALARGDLHKAADMCKSLLVAFPQSARGYHLTASLFQATGNYKKAYDYSSIAAGLDDRVAQYHMQQGQMLYILKEYAQAGEAFGRAVEISGQAAEPCRLLGNTLVAQERFDEAKRWFEKARLAAEPVDTRIDEAECALQSGELEAAEALLSDYLGAYPQSAQAHYMLALLAIYVQELDRAQDLLQAAVENDPRHGQAHFYLALLCAEGGDEQGAVKRLLQVLENEPTHLSSLLLLGGIFMKLGDFPSAEKAFSHVLALCPDHLLAWYSLLELLQVEGRGREGVQRLGEVMQTMDKSTALLHLRALFSGDVPPCAPRAFVAAFYASFVEMFEPWVVATGQTPHLETLVKSLRALPQLQEKRYASLLDLGCGTGVASRLLADFAAIRVGVDVSPHMLKIARRSKGYDVLYELDMVEYALGSETLFDVVLAAGALRWSGNLQPFFHAVRGVMHKDSILACLFEKELSTLAYSVANHGRYSHHLSYIRDVSQAGGLELVSHQEIVSKDQEQAVTRHLCFFKKMTIH